MSNWINKGLQINPGSYGILRLNAWADGCGSNEFELTIYSYIDCGGKHQHNNFSLTANGCIKVAEVLYHFGMSRNKHKEEYLLELEQEYKCSFFKLWYQA